MKHKDSERAKGSARPALAVDATEAGPPRLHASPATPRAWGSNFVLQTARIGGSQSLHFKIEIPA
jgi:hypothetical protein